jgi:cytochrome c
MTDRVLPLESREMRAFSAYARWLSRGIPDPHGHRAGIWAGSIVLMS